MVNEIVRDLSNMLEHYQECAAECQLDAEKFPVGRMEFLKLKAVYDMLQRSVQHEALYIWDWYLV